MEITVPLNKFKHIIGDIGELIFQQITEYYNLDVIGKEFSIRDYKKTGDSIRVDFVVGNDQRKNITLKKMVKNLSNNRIYSSDSMVIIKHKDEEIRYNITNYDEIIDFVIDNFILVEIKTSTSRNLSQRSKAQKKHVYYDLLIGIILQNKYKEGFIGDISSEIYLEFLNLLNVKNVGHTQAQPVFKLKEAESIPIIQKILHTGLRHYFHTRNCRLDTYYQLRTQKNYEKFSKLRDAESKMKNEPRPLPHLIVPDYLTKMGNNVNKSKERAKKENLVIMRYKILNNEVRHYETNPNFERYILHLKDSISMNTNETYTSSEEYHKEMVIFYENHDIFLWDFEKQKKEYDRLYNQRLQIKIDFSIDGRNIPFESTTDSTDCVLKVDMKSDFSRGFKFKVDKDEVDRVMLKL
jgi:hypothetical protein